MCLSDGENILAARLRLFRCIKCWKNPVQLIPSHQFNLRNEESVTSAILYGIVCVGRFWEATHSSRVDGFGFGLVINAPTSLSANLRFQMIGTGLATHTTLPLPGDFLHISDAALAKPSLKAGNKFLLFSKLLNIPVG